MVKLITYFILNSSVYITVPLEMVPCGHSHGPNKVILIKIYNETTTFIASRKKHGNMVTKKERINKYS